MRIGMEAVMQAGTTGKAFNFWLVDTIAPDQKTRNWYTGEETTVESKTSQRYFVDNLNGAAAGDTVNLYINSVGGSVKEALEFTAPCAAALPLLWHTLTDTPLLRLLSLLWRRTKSLCRAIPA